MADVPKQIKDWVSNPTAPNLPWQKIYADTIILSPNSFGNTFPKTAVPGQIFVITGAKTV